MMSWPARPARGAVLAPVGHVADDEGRVDLVAGEFEDARKHGHPGSGVGTGCIHVPAIEEAHSQGSTPALSFGPRVVRMRACAASMKRHR